MGTAFVSITQAEKDEQAAAAVVLREREIFSYETNITLYTNMLKSPTISAEYAQRLKELLVTENRELEKSKLIYETTKAMLPPATMTQLITAAKAKIDTVV